jgi:hypothetical protein
MARATIGEHHPDTQPSFTSLAAFHLPRLISATC